MSTNLGHAASTSPPPTMWFEIDTMQLGGTAEGSHEAKGGILRIVSKSSGKVLFTDFPRR